MKLLTKQLIEEFAKQGDTSKKDAKDIKVIAKFFNPCGGRNAGSGNFLKASSNISGDIFFVGADIDPLCMRMTYIQMCLLEVSAQIRYENTLTQETFEVFDTPCLQVVNAFSKNAKRKKLI